MGSLKKGCFTLTFSSSALQKYSLELKKNSEKCDLVQTVNNVNFLPTLQSSNVVYKYVCRCDSWYVGRTSQRLQDRISQHVPKFIRNKTQQERTQPERNNKITNWTPSCDSAIGTHLLTNKACAAHYNDKQFSILSKARSEFHLSVLESIYITVHQPNLCRQKEFVYKHKLIL